MDYSTTSHYYKLITDYILFIIIYALSPLKASLLLHCCHDHHRRVTIENKFKEPPSSYCHTIYYILLSPIFANGGKDSADKLDDYRWQHFYEDQSPIRNEMNKESSSIRKFTLKSSMIDPYWQFNTLIYPWNSPPNDTHPRCRENRSSRDNSDEKRFIRGKKKREKKHTRSASTSAFRVIRRDRDTTNYIKRVKRTARFYLDTNTFTHVHIYRILYGGISLRRK